jgi:hypothetical protein
LPVSAANPAITFSSSATDRLRPFIFQLPAISGRRSEAAMAEPWIDAVAERLPLRNDLRQMVV